MKHWGDEGCDPQVKETIFHEDKIFCCKGGKLESQPCEVSTGNIYHTPTCLIDWKLDSHRDVVGLPESHSLKRECKHLILVECLTLRLSSKTSSSEL